MKKTIRYKVEHELLPSALYSSGPMLLYEVMGQPGVELLRLYEKAGKEQSNYECPFSAEQFKETHQEFFRDNDAILVIRIAMPEPENTLDCRAVSLCYSRIGSHNMLFSSELGRDGQYFLCGRDWDNRRLNFGLAPENSQDETDNVASYYWEMMKNGCADIIDEISKSPKQHKSLRAS